MAPTGKHMCIYIYILYIYIFISYIVKFQRNHIPKRMCIWPGKKNPSPARQGVKLPLVTQNTSPVLDYQGFVKNCHVSHEKNNRGPLLSMKYGLFNRDPYNGLL